MLRVALVLTNANMPMCMVILKAPLRASSPDQAVEVAT